MIHRSCDGAGKNQSQVLLQIHNACRCLVGQEEHVKFGAPEITDEEVVSVEHHVSVVDEGVVFGP